jgi:hypothetical protein
MNVHSIIQSPRKRFRCDSEIIRYDCETVPYDSEIVRYDPENTVSGLSFDKNSGSLLLSFFPACDEARLSLNENALLHQFCPIFPPQLSYLLEVQFGFLIQIPRPQNQ